MHVGEVERLGEGYVGMAIHVAARVCAAAHGGQILTTEAAHRLSPDVPVLDLGEHALKDVGLVRILQVQHPELPSVFPPLRASSAQPSNLPASQDRFIGRSGELTEVQQLLESARLLTLTGPGGAGKTRLAVELGHAVIHGFNDGVWLVPLSTATDGNRSFRYLSRSAFGERPDEPLATTVEKWLRGREVLLDSRQL